MTQYKAFAPAVEVRGDVILSFVDVMGPFKKLGMQLVAEAGLGELDAETWYPQQAWLDFLKSVNSRVGPNTLHQMARQIPTHGEIPPQLDSLEKALAGLDAEYQRAHRGGDIGHYVHTRSGERSCIMVCRNPYPCDFDRGILEAVVRRLEPDNVLADVRHHDDAPCKKYGGDACMYTISW